MQEKPSDSFLDKNLQSLQVSLMTAVSPSLTMRPADFLISFKASSSVILFLPRFLDMYWLTAAGVSPSFSAVSFCER